MNGTATVANFTSQQTYMNISDQSGNKLVSSASSLLLSTSSNGPILLSVDNGTSNALIVSNTFCTLDDLNIRGTLGNVSGAIIRLGNATTLSSGYDAIQFVRVDSNPVLFCGENYFAPYASAVNGFVTGSQIGDMVLRVATGDAIRFSCNAGASSQLIINTNFKLADVSNNNRIESAAGNLLYLICNNATALVVNPAITSFYSGGNNMAYIGLQSGLDQLAFTRTTNNPNIQFGAGNYISYASGSTWAPEASAEDMILRTNNTKLIFNTNAGNTSTMVITGGGTTGNVGIAAGNSPPAKFFVKQGAQSTPSNLTDWNSNWTVFSNGTSSRSAGLGIAFDTSSTNTTVWINSLAPSVVWNNLVFSYNNIYFQSNGGGNIFNISHLGTGTVYSNGGSLTNTNPSDIRLKNTITPLQNNLDIINQLNPVSFLWNDQDKHGSKLQLGFIAQEVQKVLPAIVSEYKEPIIGPSNLTDENGMRIDECTTNLGLDTMALIPFLVGAVKELSLFQNNLKENIDHKEVIQKQQDQINHLLRTQELLVKQISELTIAMNNITSRLKS
jgi:hypothetical protein